jgi:hypothetical protein
MAALAALLLAVPARAELEDDVQRLVEVWQRQGRVDVLGPELLERGRVRPVLLPLSALDPAQSECTTVAVLGAPSTNFVIEVARSGSVPRWFQSELPTSSVAGAVEVRRCGARRALLSRLTMEMRSPRAAVRVVVARSNEPLPSLVNVLKHRQPGPVAPLTRSGPRPLSAPLQTRVSVIEARVSREGAIQMNRASVPVEANGSGERLIRFAVGCHRLDLLVPSMSEAQPRPVDVDAELITLGQSEVLDVDHTESTDASLSFCVGESTQAALRFAGARPGSAIVLLHARWELPAGLPDYWTAQARARVAEAIRLHHLQTVGGTPVYESLGVQGATLLPLEVEAGACYLVAVAAMRGKPLSIALAAQQGQEASQNHAELGGSSTATAFCAHDSEPATVEVEARGRGLVWLLGVWQTSRLPIGEVQQ